MDAAVETTEDLLNATGLTVSITVKELDRSLAWYRDALGFRPEREYERDGKRTGVVLTAGAVRILLNLDDGARGWDRTKGEGISLTINVASGVDDVAERVKAYGATLDTEPADMPWGARAFRVRDPDGFRLAISSPLQKS
jgi:uncharacterized glyoxalase superfamily protein PhnB